MNTLGKTVIAIAICLVIVAALVFTRDFGAPSGHSGEGFGTVQEALNDSMGASYDIAQDVGTVAFDDGVIYVCLTKDNKLAVSYAFLNRQQTKYYMDSYYIVDDLNATEWHSGKNKVKTNYRLASADDVITVCDNQPVSCEEYTVTIKDTPTKIKLYYNRVQ